MERLDDILDLIRTPGRYLSLELGAVKKDPSTVSLNVALAFPDTYEVGMSHLGARIIYHLMNSTSWIANGNTLRLFDVEILTATHPVEPLFQDA